MQIHEGASGGTSGASEAAPAIRVLMIHADPAVTAVVRKLLADIPAQSFQVEAAHTLQQGFRLLSSAPRMDVILSDLQLPDSRGIETFAKIFKQAPGVPIFILSDAADEAMALLTVGQGAQDYLVRSTLNSNMLLRVLRYAIERKKAEQRLYLAEEKYRTVFENSPAAIIVADGTERISSWNHYTEKLLGMQTADLFLKPVSSLYPAKEWMRIRDEHLRDKGTQAHLETCVFRKDSTLIDVEVSISVVKDVEGRVTGSIGILRDITERKKLERMKDDFISTVSHELRTPMTIIREGISQVLDGILGPTTEDMQQILSIGLEGIDRLTRIVNDLLDVSKLEAGKIELRREHLNMVELAQHVALIFAPQFQKKGIALKTLFSAAQIYCYADRDKITQVLTNLIGNSLKFTEEGEISLEVQEKPGEVVVSIKDTGRGISELDMRNVFQKFQQFGRTAGPGEKGTGLGLVISKGLVELHRGRIGVSTKIGVGSEFYFSLPRYTVREFFKEALEGKLRQAFSQSAHLSMIMLAIKDFPKVERAVSANALSGLYAQMEMRIRQSLNRKMEFASNGSDIFLLVLPSAPKDEALIVSGQIRQIMSDFITEKSRVEPLQVESRVISFPGDGETADQLLDRLGVL